ncbi:MAG: 4-hydroxythreonine-4-phosphate dehydrogenase PdxA [Candidatus Omnitrophica bacterium]|nr:4-hydroxythreonine-4-phosphate dehydrogenase PdxA [Candidatus Omnitrophota bacterium]
MKSNNKIVGITLGDPAGIGPEVIAKSLANQTLRKMGRFLLIGDEKNYARYSAHKYPNVSFLHVPTEFSKNFKIGQPSLDGARASLEYLKTAVTLLKERKIHSLATGPVCKETIREIHNSFQGHTEFLAESFGVKKFGMLFVSDKIRTIVVTRHIPLNKVVSSLTIANIFDAIELTADSLKNFYRVKNPVLAVCGVNPHAGEGGKIGTEEQTLIIPAIKKAVQKGINAVGPFAADTLFSPDIANRYDAVVAMYHDQGLIAAKTLAFSGLVNMTVGLPFVRTSPAHGTAFNIAGKGQADESSMFQAIKLAAQLS